MSERISPLTRGGPVRRPDDLDALLTRFFRSELPSPWPAAPGIQPAGARKPTPARPWFRYSSRLALAAAVALFLIGYLTLAGRFPAGNAPTGPSIRPVMGRNDGVRPLLPPRMPNRVNPNKLQGNSGLQLLRPEVEPISNGHRAESSGYVNGRTVIINVKMLP